MTLEEAIELVLTSRRHREAFLAGRTDAFGLDPEDAEALATLDPGALVEAAAACRADLAARRHRGGGGLCDQFPATVAAWLVLHPGDQHLDQLAGELMESPGYRHHRSHDRAGLGICFEEMFYRFAEASALGDAVTRERELFAAMAVALAVNPDPAFAVPPELRRVAGGWVAVARRGAPYLYAAVGGRVVSGPVTALLADLAMGRDDGVAASRHRIAPAAVATARLALDRLLG